MTRKERIQAYQEWYYNFHLTNAGCGPVFMIVLIVLTGLMGCAVKYVPVETVKVERVEVHDTVTVADSTSRNDSTDTKTRMLLQKVDSAYLAMLGVINAPREAWLLQTETNTTHKTSETTSHKESEKQSSDSVRVEYKDRPVPVERELSRWEQFCLDYGKVTTGGTVVCVFLIIAYLVRRIKKPKG